MQGRRFGGLFFDEGMRTARFETGEDVAFTRQERAVLLTLVRRPGQLVRRSTLRAALADTGRPCSERNVDFVVNRVRGRLNDNARAPRFIATQYGEGYVWIAQPDAKPPTNAFVLVGPIHGRAEAPHRADRILSALVQRLDALTGQGREIAFVPDDDGRAATGRIDYRIEASLHAEGDVIHAAFVLRTGGADQVLSTLRLGEDACSDAERGAQIAGWARDAIWRHLALPGPAALLTPADVTAELRMHEAAQALARSPESWKATDTQLQRARAEHPDDGELKVLWGLNRFAQLIQWPPHPDTVTPEGRAAIEREIEVGVLSALPDVDHNPLLKLAAAKLLFFVDRGHFELAERLADDAFAASTAFAAAHATRGQMLMCRGAFEEALSLYDKAIALSTFGSEFHIYVLVLKCTALMAADDRAGVERTCEDMFVAKPASRFLALLMVSPHAETLAPDVRAGIMAMPVKASREALTHLYNTSARHFRSPLHRANVMRGAAVQFRRVLGADAVPEDVAKLIAVGKP